MRPKCLEYLYRKGRYPYRFILRPEFTQRHHEAHIHVEGAQFGAVTISLVTLEVLAPPDIGKCPFSEIKEILKRHRLELLEEWEEACK